VKLPLIERYKEPSVFRNLKVRTKLLSIVAATAMLFGATILILGMVAKRHVVSSTAADLARSKQVISEFVDSRWRQLNAGLNSLVDSPEIRAVLTTPGIDHDTQLMSIVDLQHMLHADAVLYCNEDGRTLARTDDPFDEETIVTDMPMIAEALTGKTARGFWTVGDQTLLAMAFPVKQDELMKGVVLTGTNIRGEGASLRSLLLRDVIVARGEEVLASSLPDDAKVDVKALLEQSETNVASMAQIESVKRVATPWDKSNDSTQALATVVAISPVKGEQIKAVILVPESAVFGFYREFRNILLITGAVAIGLSVVVTFIIGAIIASQVRQTLTTLEQVAGGDLTARLDIETREEFGSIARALNTAIQASANTLGALATRNRDTKMLLDAVEQGFFTINRQGVMSEERSGAVDRLLATPTPGMTLPELLREFDAKVAGWMEMGIGDVFDEIMPVEVTIDQLPSRIIANGRTLEIKFTPVRLESQLAKLAVVISDISAKVEQERLEAEQREMMALVQRIFQDKAGFLEFFHEMEEIIESLRSDPKDDMTLTKRRVHTLKGNAGIYGLELVAAACHVIEDHIAETGELPESHAWTTLYGRWAAVRGCVRRIVGERESGVNITTSEYQEILSDILTSRSRDELAVRIASWRLEPTATRLARIAEQSRALALRLGKGTIFVKMRSSDLRLDSTQWCDFWSSFVHVVRNSVDHGLESAEDRRLHGKSEAGTIRLATTIEDSQFVISISDDGRGIAWEKVAEAARKRNLPAETHQDLVEALFVDGLSTAIVVSSTSGRGVGMGAIRAACDKLNGEIDVESKPGIGTTFRFIFPLNAMGPGTYDMLETHGVEAPERAFSGGEGPPSTNSGEFHDAPQAHAT
jgi:signal transduction histidine kinase